MQHKLLLHEHPAHAKSWALSEIKRMMEVQGVDVIEADQCMFGLRTRSVNGIKLTKKPKKFMTNSRVIGDELRRKCDGTHPHQPLSMAGPRMLPDTRRHCAELSAGV